MKNHFYRTGLLLIGALLVQPAFAEPVPGDNTASLRAKQIRLDLDAKRKELAEQAAPASQETAAVPSPALDLPIDQTDSPGATK
jgi:hypothetical protein